MDLGFICFLLFVLFLRAIGIGPEFISVVVVAAIVLRAIDMGQVMIITGHMIPFQY